MPNRGSANDYQAGSQLRAHSPNYPSRVTHVNKLPVLERFQLNDHCTARVGVIVRRDEKEVHKDSRSFVLDAEGHSDRR